MSTPSEASQAIQTQILLILSGGRELRQFEIAAELQVPEHNNWTTHAILEDMFRSELVSFEWYHNILKNGRLSKIPYRFFRLTTRGEELVTDTMPIHRTLWVGCITRIKAILGV
jgi:Mn-dependent DtxR family transcriptional regulator